jgi:hypothetical protein
MSGFSVRKAAEEFQDYKGELQTECFNSGLTENIIPNLGHLVFGLARNRAGWHMPAYVAPPLVRADFTTGRAAKVAYTGYASQSRARRRRVMIRRLRLCRVAAAGIA